MADLLTSIASGVAQTTASHYSQNFSPTAKLRQSEEREERRLRAAERETQLGELQLKSDTQDQRGEVAQQELELLKQQNHQAMAENARQTTFSAFDRYTADYNPRHLNTMLAELRNNPAGAELFGDAVRVDAITEQDRGELEKMGWDADLVFANPEIQNELIKVTHADGSIAYEDMTEIFKMTGYEEFASDRELDRQLKAAQVMRAWQQDGLRTADERQAHRIVINEGITPGTPEYHERFAEVYGQQDEQTYVGTREEREAERRTLSEGLEKGTSEYDARYNSIYNEIVARDRQTAPSRNLDEAEQAKVDIQERAESRQEDFFELDFSDRSNRLVYENDINRIERLGGLGMDPAQKRELNYMKQLIAVSNRAGQITDEETGLIDSFSRGVRNYLSDNVQGLDTTSSYMAYRNILRHALYGSALTEAEIKSFNQQFGTLGQQTGPVLQQFRTALVQLRAKLEGIEQLNDSYVAHFRLGVDQTELANIIGGLDDRIDFFERQYSGAHSTEPGPSPLDEETIQGLDAIRGGSE